MLLTVTLTSGVPVGRTEKLCENSSRQYEAIEQSSMEVQGGKKKNKGVEHLPKIRIPGDWQDK